MPVEVRGVQEKHEVPESQDALVYVRGRTRKGCQ
jgi:hypothetical protein